MTEQRATYGDARGAPEVAFRIVGRACFLAASGTALAAAVLLAVSTSALTSDVRVALVASLVVYAVLTAWTSWRSGRPGFALRESGQDGASRRVSQSLEGGAELVRCHLTLPKS